MLIDFWQHRQPRLRTAPARRRALSPSRAARAGGDAFGRIRAASYHGKGVSVGGSSAQAMERLAGLDRVPDLVISDYRLRGGEVGTNVIRRIRERVGTPVPGIIPSGETGSETQDAASASDPTVIHKPISRTS